MSDLEVEIAARRRAIVTDAYSMSIGELTNLYRDGELDVHPEFQRIFRWDKRQKTRLIESILLGIPLPSVFIAQADTGLWDVVDGVQRLSTILQFQGVLLDDEGQLVEPLVLDGTELLPSLEGKRWESEVESESLTVTQRLDIKRAKLNLQIVKRESSAESKYDLFQRLNSYGSQATAQEVRSCILISISRDFYAWLRELAEHESFLSTISISDRLRNEQYNFELALRFLIFRTFPEEEIPGIGNLGEFLTSEASKKASDPDYDLASEGQAFRATFDLLAESGGDDVFRRWNSKKSRFEGAFLNTAFEVVGMGLGYNVAQYVDGDVQALDRAKTFWSDDEYSAGFATGVRADARMAKTIPFGRKIFAR
jgi:hypothetical protein